MNFGPFFVAIADLIIRSVFCELINRFYHSFRIGFEYRRTEIKICQGLRKFFRVGIATFNDLNGIECFFKLGLILIQKNL